MFQVHREWEMPSLSSFTNEQIKTYKFVSIVLHVYHFLVVHTVNDGDIELRDQTLLSSIPDVIDIINEMCVEKIYLIVPHYVNENDEMCMTMINEIHQWEKDSNCGFLYKCSNGASYYDSPIGDMEPEFMKQGLVYSYKKYDHQDYPEDRARSWNGKSVAGRGTGNS